MDRRHIGNRSDQIIDRGCRGVHHIAHGTKHVGVKSDDATPYDYKNGHTESDHQSGERRTRARPRRRQDRARHCDRLTESGPVTGDGGKRVLACG